MNYLPERFWSNALRRPAATLVLLRAGLRLRPNGWWKQSPFLPLPDKKYWAFRIATALGDSTERLSFDEAVDAARWSVRQRRAR